jgi:hypothetical protein
MCATQGDHVGHDVQDEAEVQNRIMDKVSQLMEVFDVMGTALKELNSDQ